MQNSQISEFDSFLRELRSIIDQNCLTQTTHEAYAIRVKDYYKKSVPVEFRRVSFPERGDRIWIKILQWLRAEVGSLPLEIIPPLIHSLQSNYKSKAIILYKCLIEENIINQEGKLDPKTICHNIGNKINNLLNAIFLDENARNGDIKESEKDTLLDIVSEGDRALTALSQLINVAKTELNQREIALNQLRNSLPKHSTRRLRAVN